jgi:hypothetical protein
MALHCRHLQQESSLPVTALAPSWPPAPASDLQAHFVALKRGLAIDEPSRSVHVQDLVTCLQLDGISVALAAGEDQPHSFNPVHCQPVLHGPVSQCAMEPAAATQSTHDGSKRNDGPHVSNCHTWCCAHAGFACVLRCFGLLAGYVLSSRYGQKP